MENQNILYYDGTSSRPSIVRVLVLQDHLHLYKDEDTFFNEAFPVSSTSQNRIGNNVFVYLDQTGLKYLQFNADDPIAVILSAEQEKFKSNWSQKLGRLKTPVLLTLLIALSVGLYFLVINFIPFIGMRLISVDQEIVIGEKLKDAMLRDNTGFGETVDEKGSRQLQQFADKLRLSSSYPINVTLVNSDIVNAYALPGGNVVMYKGILQKMQSPEELVALFAHESTHINERHSLRSLLRSAANGIIISLVFGDASGISGAIVSTAETLNGLHYSRSLEREADWKGMNLMLANKINVYGMRQLMQRLQEEEKLPGNFSFISSHPLTRDRIEAVDLYAAKNRQIYERRNDLNMIFEKLKDTIRD